MTAHVHTLPTCRIHEFEQTPHDGMICHTCGTSEASALRVALMDIAAQERPNHEHYDDPADCAHCRSYLLLGIETLEEQNHD